MPSSPDWPRITNLLERIAKALEHKNELDEDFDPVVKAAAVSDPSAGWSLTLPQPTKDPGPIGTARR